MSYSSSELVAMLSRMVGTTDALDIYNDMARVAVSYEALSSAIVILTGHKG